MLIDTQQHKSIGTYVKIVNYKSNFIFNNKRVLTCLCLFFPPKYLLAQFIQFLISCHQQFQIYGQVYV